MRKKWVGVMFSVVLTAGCLGACKGTNSVQDKTSSVQQETKNGMSQDNRVSEKMIESKKEILTTKSKVILVVSFGTSYNESRDKTIGAIEQTIQKTFPEYDVRRAFTSQIIIDKLKERDGVEIDNVEEALEKAAKDGIKEIVVQPTHLMNGYEYQDLAKELTGFLDQFDSVYLGEPLLSGDADFYAVINAITEASEQYDDKDTAICFMGHGTGADSNKVYVQLQKKIREAGYQNYYIGTVEAEPTLENVMTSMETDGKYKRAVLRPLMVVAGDHANNDMAGDEEDSWKSILENAGYKTVSILEGLGELEAIQNLYAGHVRDVISSGEKFEGVKEDEKQNKEVDGKIQNGIYDVKVESNSSMFQVVQAKLIVLEDENMEAVITLSGTGYDKLYMGTKEEAGEKENESAWIPFSEDEHGSYTFTIPVQELDKPIDCAAYSKKKEIWYDRQITFVSSSLEKEVQEQNETEKNAEGNEKGGEIKQRDGDYTIEITMEGGSGKAKILSPVTLHIENGKTMATLQWNSENYDYMIVDGDKYLPIRTELGSVFEIPVNTFDEKMTVIGDTVAMSKPREIEYQIIFHSETLKTLK